MVPGFREDSLAKIIENNMKAEQLKKALNHLIKSEVAKAINSDLRAIIAEEINKSMAKLLVEVIGPKNSPTEPQAPAPSRVYTKNPRLDEALNSTVFNMKKSQSRAPLPSSVVSLSDMFDKIDSPEEAISAPAVEIDHSSKIGMLKSIVSTTPVAQQHSVLDTPNTVLNSVLKKDFRSLMRKIDEKKNKSSGYFPAATMMTPQIGGYDT